MTAKAELINLVSALDDGEAKIVLDMLQAARLRAVLGSARTHAEHQAKNAAKQQVSADNHARQAELNRQHDVDAANRAAADRAAAQRQHDADAANRAAAADRATQERQRRDEADRRFRQQQDDDRRRRNGF